MTEDRKYKIKEEEWLKQTTASARHKQEIWENLLKRPRVIKGPAVDKDETYEEFMLRRKIGLCCFIESVKSGGKSHKHMHVLEALFYVLEGKGYEIHDGEKYEWEAGDAVFVPPGGVVHQHFNADSERPSKALVFHLGPVYTAANLLQSKEIELPDGFQFAESDYWREGASGDI